MADKKEKFDKIKYNKTYYDKHKKELQKTEMCDQCGGSYTKWNKGHHNKTLKHKYGMLQKKYDNIKNK